MFRPNLRFVALPFPEIIGSTPKNWAVPGYANTPFSKFYWTFVRMDRVVDLGKFEVCCFTQWRFYVGAGGAIAPPVFGFAPPVRHATKIVTMNTVTLLSRLFC